MLCFCVFLVFFVIVMTSLCIFECVLFVLVVVMTIFFLFLATGPL